MAFDICSGRLDQIAGAVTRQRFGDGRCVGIEDFDAGCFKHAKRFRAAMTGDEAAGARLDDGLRGLNTSTLRGILVLVIADDFTGFALQVENEEVARAAEARIEWSRKAVALGGENDFHGRIGSVLVSLMRQYWHKPVTIASSASRNMEERSLVDHIVIPCYLDLHSNNRWIDAPWIGEK